MKKSDILLFFSLILAISSPFVAKKAKVPTFISPEEQRIADAREPAKIEIVQRKDFTTAEIRDPFRVAERAKLSATNQRKPLPTGSISLIYLGRERYVIINDRIFKEGDVFENLTVAKILNDRILLKSPEGEEIWLRIN